MGKIFGSCKKVGKNLMRTILITGLSGSGKTTLAEILASTINAELLTDTIVRKKQNNNDFSPAGRQKSFEQMKKMSENLVANNKVVILENQFLKRDDRQKLNPDYVIWMDTQNIETDIFEEPKKYDYKITEKNSQMHSILIKQDLVKKFPEIQGERI